MNKLLLLLLFSLNIPSALSSVGHWEASANCVKLLAIENTQLEEAKNICLTDSIFDGREELYTAISYINSNIETVILASQDADLIQELTKIRYEFTNIQIMLIGDDNH